MATTNENGGENGGAELLKSPCQSFSLRVYCFDKENYQKFWLVKDQSEVPTINIEGYKFRFYSSDINEPPHVHVIQGENMAKIWLQPVVVEHNYGYHQAELNRILRLTRQNQNRLLEVWNAHFSQ